MNITLTTPRLILRRARSTDLLAMHAVLSDAVATRYWSTPPHRDLEETERWLAGMMATGTDDFVVTLGERVIGKAGFFRDPEIGFILRSDLHGNGYGFEAACAVVRRAFCDRALPEIVADVDPRNQASLRMLARLGFVETGRKSGTWQVGSELCDSVYLALNAERFHSLWTPTRP